jgi:hypothetical protein
LSGGDDSVSRAAGAERRRRGSSLDDHRGHCRWTAVADLADNLLVEVWLLQATQAGPHAVGQLGKKPPRLTKTRMDPPLCFS